MRKVFLILAFGIGVLIIGIALWVTQQSTNLLPALQLSQIQENLKNWGATLFQLNSDSTTQVTSNPQTPISENSESTSTEPVAPSFSAADYLAQGELALSQNQFAKAAEKFALAASLEPQAPEPLLKLAEAQIGLQEFNRAYANLKMVTELEPNSPAAFLLQGKLFLREENFPAARAAFQQAGALAQFEQALMAAFYDDLESAQEILLNTDDERAQVLLKALTEYTIFPDAPKTYQDALLTRAFNEIQEYELASAKIKPVLAQNVHYRDAWILLGYAYFAQEEFAAALSAFQTAYSLDPTKPETQYFLAKTHFALGNLTEAEKFLHFANEQEFAIPNFANELTNILIAQGKFTEAAEFLTKNLLQNENATLAEFEAAILLWLEETHDKEKAWELTRTALSRFPENATVYNLAGKISLANGQISKALSQLEYALELEPNFAPAFLTLGELYEQMRNRKLALEHYKKAFTAAQENSLKNTAAERFNTLLATN